MARRRSLPHFNHAFSIAFSVDTAHEAESVTDAELFAAVRRRLRDLRANPGEIQEACGAADDTYINNGHAEDHHDRPRRGCAACRRAMLQEN